MPFPKLAVTAGGVLLFLGGLGILAWFMVPLAVLLLVVFLVPVTFKMHAFWKEKDPMSRMGEYVQFTKNMALVGAVLMLLFVGTVWVY